VDHRRRHAGESHSLALDQIEECSRLELLDDHVSPAHPGYRVTHAPAVAMKLRKGVKINIALVDAELADRVHRVDVEIAMREHHPLRSAGRARGVEQRGGFVFINLDWRGRFRRSFGQQRLVVEPITGGALATARGADEMLDRLKLRTNLFDKVCQALFDD